MELGGFPPHLGTLAAYWKRPCSDLTIKDGYPDAGHGRHPSHQGDSENREINRRGRVPDDPPV